MKKAKILFSMYAISWALLLMALASCEKDYQPQPTGANLFQEYVMGSWEVNSISYIATEAVTIYDFSKDGKYTLTVDGIITGQGQWTFYVVDFKEASVALNGKVWSWPAWEFVFKGYGQITYYNNIPTVMTKID